MRNWSETEISQALQMRENGASSREIGLRLNRSAAAVRTALSQWGMSQSRDEWLAGFCTGEPIEYCPEQKRLMRNAVIGSAKLRDAILGLAA
jgi:hypothetical protein